MNIYAKTIKSVIYFILFIYYSVCLYLLFLFASSEQTVVRHSWRTPSATWLLYMATSFLRVRKLFELHGHHHCGEPVSQLNHAIQAGKTAKFVFPNDPEFVTATLLHDVGYLVAINDWKDKKNVPNRFFTLGVKNHERVGAEYLRKEGFSERTVEMVRCHVLAKLWKNEFDPFYKNTLSDASKKTLKEQNRFVVDFKPLTTNRDMSQILRLRKIDERSKDPNLSYKLESLDEFQKFIEQSLEK